MTSTQTTTKIIGKATKPIGEVPAVVLSNPKYTANVGKALRLASCYGLRQLWYTGDRIKIDDGRRLPREERMKGYKDVDLIQFDYPFDCFPKLVNGEPVTPVAIEVRENAEPLHTFVHPKNPVYIFGPEDGFIPQTFLRHCHRFLVIPTRHCLNLANAVSTVLWDRQQKMLLAGEVQPVNPIEYENRGGVFDGED